MEPSEKELAELSEIRDRSGTTDKKSTVPNLVEIEAENEKLKVKRTFSPPLLRPNSSIVSSRRTSENLSDDLAAAFSALTTPSSPIKSTENEIIDGSSRGFNMGSGKAYYYSQLSIMLFERAVEENPAFPEDLDRVHSWFTKELSDAQKLVCLHELLSLISPSQHSFLFTSVAFDTHQSGEDEAVWLDLAMSEAQKQQSTRASNETINKLEDRLKSLDLRPGESLFSGLKVTKSKFPAEKFEIVAPPDDLLAASDSLTSSQSQLQIPQCLSPASSSDTSKFSAILKMPIKGEEQQPQLHKNKQYSTPLAPGNAPPGFLSPTAPEFRPSEPSCYSEIYTTDFSKWLRLLRLHKYDACLTPVHAKDKVELLKYTDNQLEAEGVAALGARTKLLRLFARVRNELSL